MGKNDFPFLLGKISEANRELFPTAGICRAYAFAPFVLGISLYYYSLAFMGMILGLSITVAVGKN